MGDRHFIGSLQAMTDGQTSNTRTILKSHSIILTIPFLVVLHEIDQNEYRPLRKVYRITDIGLQELLRWTLQPTNPEIIRDEFLLKAYNSWLVESEKMIPLIEERKKEHEEKLTIYLDKVNELKDILTIDHPQNPILSSISVVEFGVEYEKLYIKCGKTSLI